MAVSVKDFLAQQEAEKNKKKVTSAPVKTSQPKAQSAKEFLASQQGTPTTPKPTGAFQTAKDFLQNLPTMIARGVSQPVEAVEKTGSTIGKKLAEISPLQDTVVSTAANFVAPGFAPTLKYIADKTGVTQKVKEKLTVSPETAAKIKSVQKAYEAPITLPYQTTPLIGDTKAFESKKEAAGSIGEAALNIALGLEGFSAVNAGRNILKQGAKQTLEAIAKNGAKETIKKIAKQGLKDFFLGTAFGTASGLQRKDSTATDIAQEALITGGIATVAAPVLGTVLKAVGAAGGLTKDLIGAGTEKLATKLETVAGKEAAAPVIEQLASDGPRFFQGLDAPVKKTFLEKAAGKTAAGLRLAQKAPGKIATQINRYAPVKPFQEKAEAAGINTGNLVEDVQGARYRAGGKAENRLDDYLDIRGKYGDDWNSVKEASRYLDAMDRLGNGDIVTGGLTAEGAQHNLERLFKTMSPEQEVKVRDGIKQLQTFLNDELLDAVDSGRISKEQYLQIKAKHPNYIPHEVLDAVVAGQEQHMGASNSFSVTKSGIEKTKGGSLKDIEDIDAAVVNRLYKNRLLSEKNKTISNIIDVGEQMGAKESGFIPQRTADQVEARNNALTQLVQLRNNRDVIADDIRLVGSEDKELVAKLNDLNKQIDELSQQAINAHLGTDEEEAKVVRELLTIKEDARPIERAEAKGKRVSEDEKLVLDTETKERLKVVNSDISELERDLAKARMAYEDKRVRISEGEKLTITREENAVARKQEELVTALQEKEHIINRGMEPIKVEFPPAKVKVTASSRNVEPTPKAAIEANIIGKTNKEIETLKGRISDREVKLKAAEQQKDVTERQLDMLYEDLQAKKAKIKETMDTVRANQDKKLKDIPEGFEKVSRYKNGIREDWLIPTDLARALKNSNSKLAGAFMEFFHNNVIGKAMTMPAKITRKLATGVNAVFALFSNPIRDMQTIAMTFDHVTPDDYAKGLWRTLTGGEYHGNEELYRLARSEGALQGSVFRENLTGEQLIQRKLEKTGLFQKAMRPDKIIEDAGQRMEEMSRLIVFKRAMQVGMSPREAAGKARNATVDFGKNGDTLQVLNQVIPFLNARVQGFSNLATTIKNDPTRAIRAGMYTAAMPAIFLNSYNSHYESYQNIPDDIKRKYWIIMTGEVDGKDPKGKAIKVPLYGTIPKGEAQQAISNVMERIMTIGKEKHPDTTGAFMLKVVGDMSPVSEASLVPEGLRQWIETKTNYSLYRDKQIEPDYIKVGKKYKKTEELEPRYHSNEQTSEIAKAIGDVFNWSPMKIDYVIKTGAMDQFIKTLDLTQRGFTGKSLGEKITEIPGVSTFYRSADYGQAMRDKAFELQKLRDKNTKKIESKK